ncbi:hypothetical protein LEP1GSC133_2256 [Leptospira borgpetersenii serovar Pomona str. 200901868]|uniref:Uncharacterized protein n=1 Tax=Leptospira borgpetersenii serovar Pomona str. 200901868 TaxID=1192866 RepID=M6W2J5_LEPBO|nr:hypothetical protein LEP1GSC133_2256 [Leptospira borgpetersenii serovar Pomona str. 200901868]
MRSSHKSFSLLQTNHANQCLIFHTLETAIKAKSMIFSINQNWKVTFYSLRIFKQLN